MKKIILFIAFPLPILVFVFLKFFGKNEFEVPVYYTEGIGRVIDGCPFYPAPYTVPDSLLTKWGWTGEKASLIVLDQKGIKDNLKRVADIFDEGDYSTLFVENANTNIRNCVLMSGDTSKVVVVDDKRQIRGYYTPTTQKDTDRLGVELRILLKQY
jgi:hypothetical protein